MCDQRRGYIKAEHRRRGEGERGEKNKHTRNTGGVLRSRVGIASTEQEIVGRASTHSLADRVIRRNRPVVDTIHQPRLEEMINQAIIMEANQLQKGKKNSDKGSSTFTYPSRAIGRNTGDSALTGVGERVEPVIGVRDRPALFILRIARELDEVGTKLDTQIGDLSSSLCRTCQRG